MSFNVPKIPELPEEPGAINAPRLRQRLAADHLRIHNFHYDVGLVGAAQFPQLGAVLLHFLRAAAEGCESVSYCGVSVGPRVHPFTSL